MWVGHSQAWQMRELLQGQFTVQMFLKAWETRRNLKKKKNQNFKNLNVGLCLSEDGRIPGIFKGYI